LQNRANVNIKDRIVTIILIIINVIVFLVEEANGGSTNLETAIRFGAEYVPYVQMGEYYRLFTACFLHFGFYHLISNMFSLYMLGYYVERIYGKVRFLIIYIIGGIAGNLLTLAVESQTGSYSVSAGASGAIFALLGTFLVLALSRRFKIASLGRVVLAIFITIAPGFYDAQIGLLAHVGGLIGGFIVSLILFPTLRLGKREP